MKDKIVSSETKQLPIMLLTSGEASLLVTLGELHMEIGDQCVDVVVPLNLQAERRGERQLLRLHCVDVHLLLEVAKVKLSCCKDKSLNMQYFNTSNFKRNETFNASLR